MSRKEKKEPKKYTPKIEPPPPRSPVPQHEHHCMHGCGTTAGSLQGIRSHEANCSRRPQ